jgi:hypothetical protein
VKNYVPMIWMWDVDENGNGVMRPARAYARLAERLFTYGEQYRLEPREERSGVAHRHYFAALREAFDNLPEDQTHRWPSVEHFRHWLLCTTGWCDETNFVLDGPEGARRLAVMLRKTFPFAVITIEGNVVRQYVAKSQSTSAMNKDEFQRSKNDVLDAAAKILGVTRSELTKQGERA